MRVTVRAVRTWKLLCFLFGATACAAIVGAGCALKQSSTTGATATESTPETTPLLMHAIAFAGPDGRKLFKLDPDGSEVELEDGAGKDLAEFKIKNAELIMKSPGGGEVMRFLELRAGTITAIAEDAEGSGGPAYTITLEPDGDATFEDHARSRRLELKKRDYGYKVVDGADKELCKVRVRDGKTSIRDPNDLTVLSAQVPLPALAAACFALDGVPREMQAGLCIAVIHWNPEKRAE